MPGQVPKPNFVAEYEMTRSYGEGYSFIMMEGETDEQVWGRFGATACRFVPSQGKDNILDALKAFTIRDAEGIGGIIDLDYTLIRESYEREMPNLLFDDCHPDLELMILNSATFVDVLKKKVDRDDDPKIEILVDLLQAEAKRLAMEFGYFRLLNDCKGYGISFSRFWDERSYSYDEFVDVEDINSIKFRRDSFAKRLAEFHNAKGKSNRRIRSRELLERVEKLKKVDKFKMPNIKLCQGHETVAIIAHLLPILFKAVFGHNLPGYFRDLCHRKRLEERLREEYKDIYFKETSLFNCIRAWESTNSPYRILKPEI